MKVIGEEIKYEQKKFNMPEYLMIEPTNKCNLKCITCSRESIENFGEMDFTTFKKIIDIFPKVKNIKFHGLGEPLLAKDAIKMLEYLRSKSIKTIIVSNLQWKNIDISYLMKLIDHIYISYHALTKQQYYKICGNGDWDLLHNNIERIKKEKGDVDVVLNYVCTKENIHTISNMIDRASDLGIKNVRFQIVQNWEDSIEKNAYRRVDNLRIDNVAYISKQFSNAIAKSKTLNIAVEIVGNDEFDYNHCVWPFSRAYITWSGEVVPCCMRPTPKFTMGNILETDFSQIWESDKYIELRDNLSTGKPGIMCYKCPYKELAPTIKEIKKYMKDQL